MKSIAVVSYWKIVVCGVVFAPFAALLAYRPDCSPEAGLGRPALFASAMIAGAVASYFCALPARRSDGLSGFGRILRGIVGSLGLFSSGFIVEAGWRLSHPAALWVTSGPFLFVAMMGFWSSFLLLYFDRQNSLARAASAQLRVRGLEAQIQPHFFFNTLNTVSAFIPEQPEAAQAIVSRLAGLFRKTLSFSDSAVIPLRDEIEITREYLEIEQARFGRRLRFVLPEERVGNLRIPALTLQPVVENAVRHGIARLPEGGEVCVLLDVRTDCYALTITNPVEDVRDVDFAHMKKDGHSLQMIDERLRLLYRGKAKLTMAADGRDVRVTVQIPGDGTCAR